MTPMSDLPSGRIKAVLFDAVGTLFDVRGSVGELYREIAADFGSEADAQSIQEAFVEYCNKVGTPVDKASWKLLVRGIFDRVGPVEDFERFFEALYEAFRTDTGWRPYPETTQVLEALRVAKLKLGIVSNFDRRLHDVLHALELNSFFSTVTIPSSCGYPKPDRRIFEHAIHLLKVPAAETLFVGDHVVQDFEAAQAAGLTAVLIKRSEGDTDQRPGLISNLLEILPLLDISTSSTSRR